jgi:hypothetical protein
VHRLPRRTAATDPPWPRNHARCPCRSQRLTAFGMSTATQADAEGNTASESIHGTCRVLHLVLPHHATEATPYRLPPATSYIYTNLCSTRTKKRRTSGEDQATRSTALRTGSSKITQFSRPCHILRQADACLCGTSTLTCRSVVWKR